MMLWIEDCVVVLPQAEDGPQTAVELELETNRLVGCPAVEVLVEVCVEAKQVVGLTRLAVGTQVADACIERQSCAAGPERTYGRLVGGPEIAGALARTIATLDRRSRL